MFLERAARGVALVLNLHLVVGKTLLGAALTVKRLVTLPFGLIGLGGGYPLHLGSDGAEFVKVGLQVEPVLQDLSEQQVELVPQLMSLRGVFAIDELLDLGPETVERSARPPGQHQVSDDHAQPTTPLETPLKVSSERVS